MILSGGEEGDVSATETIRGLEKPLLLQWLSSGTYLYELVLLMRQVILALYVVQILGEPDASCEFFRCQE